MKKRVAIIDLGTNTFNLLIVEAEKDSPYKIIASKKHPVKLGAGGIHKGKIAADAYKRGIAAIDHHVATIKSENVDHIKAFGTSALRSANNGKAFLDEIYARTKIEVEIISGDREAELIYYGVRQTLKPREKPFIILDIGGGSNEFIIADMNKVYWKKSYPLGIARLLEMFKPTDPLSSEDIERITAHVEGQLSDLFEIIPNFGIDTMVGASGSFETFVSMINEYDVIETEGHKSSDSVKIDLNDFNNLSRKLIKSTHAEREKMKGLEPMRIEMIVLASLFVKFILEKHNFKSLYQSNFALKEGAVYEIIKDEE